MSDVTLNASIAQDQILINVSYVKMEITCTEGIYVTVNVLILLIMMTRLRLAKIVKQIVNNAQVELIVLFVQIIICFLMVIVMIHRHAQLAHTLIILMNSVLFVIRFVQVALDHQSTSVILVIQIIIL